MDVDFSKTITNEDFYDDFLLRLENLNSFILKLRVLFAQRKR